MNGSKKTIALTYPQFAYIVSELERRGDIRMACICLLLGKCIRIGDVLKTITVTDVYHTDGTLRDRMVFTEQKTGKSRSIKLMGSCTERLFTEYWEVARRVPGDSPLFYGAKTGLPLKDKGVKFILAKFVGQEGIEQCSPHSFRKYGARYLFDNGVDIEVISQVLNHSSVKETRTYLDIKTKDVEKAMDILNY